MKLEQGKLYKKAYPKENAVEWNYVLDDDYIVYVFDDGFSYSIDCPFVGRFYEDDVDVELCDLSNLTEEESRLFDRIKREVCEKYNEAQKIAKILLPVFTTLQQENNNG